MRIVKVNSSLGCLGKNIGCEKAPDEVVKFLEKDDLNEDFNLVRNIDVGRVDITKEDIEEANKRIFDFVKEGDFIIGGDHSITYPCFKKLATLYKDVGLLIFDAHADAVDGNRPCSHEDFVRVLVKEGFSVVLVGVRSAVKVEHDFLKKNKVRCFWMKYIFNNLEDTCDSVMEIMNSLDAFYLSLDIDVVDPANAPGTGYLEPGGFSSRELLYFIQKLKMMKNLKMVDLVEINPLKDVNEMTVRLGSKIVKEFI